MILFYPHLEKPGELTGAGRSARPSSGSMFVKSLRRHARRAIGRSIAVLRIMQRAAVAAMTRRVARELRFRGGSYDRRCCEPDAQQGHASDRDAVKFPQRPLVLGDKWDF